MKRIILLSLVLIASYTGFAQCTPSALLTRTGIYPSALPNAVVGQAYNQVITFRFPKDTTIFFQTTTIDTVYIVSIEGFPSSYTNTCNIPNCQYIPSGSEIRGCVSISGTPVLADVGTKTIKVNILAKVTINPPPPANPIKQSIPYSDSSVTFTTTGGSTYASRIVNNTFSVEQNYPNPFSDNTDIIFTSPKADRTDIRVYDMLGKIVFQTSVAAKVGRNVVSVDGGNFKPGYYMYSVCNSIGCKTMRMSKN